MRKLSRSLILLLLVGLVFVVATAEQGWTEPTKGSDRLLKPSVFEHAQFDGNTIATWLANDGLIVSQRKTGNSGMEWPKGSGKTIDYASGIWFCGQDANGSIRTAAAEYASEFKAGPVIDGAPADPEDPAYRIYTINSDGTGDWDVWPFDQGAPALEAADGSDSLDASGNKIPRLIGDQTLFWVMNDFASSQHTVFSTQPMGLEVKVSVFGFNKADPLGNVMFMEFDVTNKSENTYDSCYVALWDDPDLGDASDDLVGCDTTLSLGYCYNGGPVDATYGTTPPAIGMDFFQGPEVPVGSGNYLPMTGFVYYYNGAPDPYGDPEDANQMFNFMKGFASDGSAFLDHNGEPTQFVFAGDPVSGTGHIDDHPDDRRFLMASGPFTMAPGDNQVIVGSKIIAPGTDNKSSITALKFFDSYAQNAFDNGFDLPQPAAPIVKAAPMDGKIVLNWQDAAGKFESIESYSFSGYEFEGYNVYQGESEAGPWKLIGTFDVDNDYGIIFDKVFDASAGMVLDKPVTFGANSGVSRNITIDSDKISGFDLYNFKKYYFAVTSYAVNEMVSPKVAESGLNAVVVVPTGAPLGQEYTAEVDEMMDGEHVTGVSNGALEVKIIDPSALTGHTYQVYFEKDDEGTVTYGIKDKTTDTILGSGYTNQAGGEDYPIFDGLKFYISGAPLAWAGDGDGVVEVAYAGTPLTEDQYDAAGTPYGGNKVWHSLNNGDADVRYFINTNGNGDIARAYRYIDYAVPFDFELRFTETGGYGVYAFTDDKIATTPFELWNIGSATPDDPSDDYQMIPFLLESDDATKDAWGWNTATEGTWGFPCSDAIYWMDPDGVDGYSKFAAKCAEVGAGNTYPYADDGSAQGYWIEFHGGFVYPIGRMVVAEYSEVGTPPPAGTTVRINTTKPNSTKDTFEFTAPAVNSGKDVAKADLEKINAVPNPYFAWSANETQPTNRIVRFTNLPKEGATIRIFDLAGNFVRLIDDETRKSQGTDNSTYAEWDVRNAADVPVASGMYLVHVEVDGVGEKVLKVAIINRDERLIYY